MNVWFVVFSKCRKIKKEILKKIKFSKIEFSLETAKNEESNQGCSLCQTTTATTTTTTILLWYIVQPFPGWKLIRQNDFGRKEMGTIYRFNFAKINNEENNNNSNNKKNNGKIRRSYIRKKIKFVLLMLHYFDLSD